MNLDPTSRPAPQIPALITHLADHRVRWVLCGSYVLTLYGAAIVPNDLDVVPDLAADNLARVADCLAKISAIPCVCGPGWGAAETIQTCRAWTADPPTADNLDYLFVTELGMLDIVIKLADPYQTLASDAAQMEVADVPFLACDPRRVLRALEPRKRKKDRLRRRVYDEMRAQFGMPPMDPAG